MKPTQFEQVSLSFLFKGKKRNIVDHLTHAFDFNEQQIWLTEDRLLLNAMFHLMTSNVQPTRGKVTQPIQTYFAIRPISILNHFSLKQYLRMLLAVITPIKNDSQNTWDLLCHHHQMSQKKLGDIVEYLPVETQISLSLSLAILLNTPLIFIQNGYLNSALNLLPESLHVKWQEFLTKNRVISVAYNEKEPYIDPCIHRLVTFTPHGVVATERAAL